MKKDCPILKSKFKNKFEHFKKNKKAFQANWNDNDSSSSEDEEMDKEVANMCFMAQADEVSNFINQDELLDAFNELFLEFKKKKKWKTSF